ncbi:SDR family NAD(P)-dependent oxidoreductase [Mycobacteroides abscessus]|uniref:Oxidoreductase yjgI n=3 Tax=Mycobacteroides abscessus TaxID=36809 RepID=A0AB74FJK5_9MYCO|nr:3-oxoacyl-ACP reductase family protein [Mycobacteroides abscessus]EUA64654.1 short chain dehydrogenase family protein [Mycobacteroides abscessus 1948]AMU44506.1 oxidoreductase [Mycobacteroides abscessus]AMU49476.1 oxidoreductase [Mycobacteroides abscessus]ANO08149.1 oxidoreductase [Mycobacteroides abscessus]ANO17916.1 oxidoreductase [Mycobacteroides abscessus]
MTSPLKSRRAFVTGGSRGIGAGIVRRLAEDGARVVFTYSSSVQQAADVVDDINEDGGWARAVKADVADPDQLGAAIGQAAEELGGLDILVNNAGILSIGDVDTATLADFDEIVAVNVRAVFAGIKAASPHLTEGGRIVTIGSINGDSSPTANLSLYSMTKAAVAGLTRGLAREFGPRGITINNVQPGPIGTDMNPEDGQLADILRPNIAVGRYGQPRDIASLVSYLVSDEAWYITGTAINIDGGFTA